MVSETSSSVLIRILSLNLHKGFSATNRRFVLPALRQAVRGQFADLVFLQEVQGEHYGRKSRRKDWPDKPQYEYLADSIWNDYAYGRNAVYPKGHHGNAVLSKYPILSWENHDISAHPVEQRGVLHCRISLPETGGTFHVMCAHLGLTQWFRRKQYQFLRNHIGALPGDEPLILAGDFNDWSGRAGSELQEPLGLTEAHQSVHGRVARTFPAFLPLLPLDRIYIRGFEVVASEKMNRGPWSRLSDHAALSATLKILGGVRA